MAHDGLRLTHRLGAGALSTTCLLQLAWMEYVVECVQGLRCQVPGQGNHTRSSVLQAAEVEVVFHQKKMSGCGAF